jgi:hypothetical protein
MRISVAGEDSRAVTRLGSVVGFKLGSIGFILGSIGFKLGSNWVPIFHSILCFQWFGGFVLQFQHFLPAFAARSPAESSADWRLAGDRVGDVHMWILYTREMGLDGLVEDKAFVCNENFFESLVTDRRWLPSSAVRSSEPASRGLRYGYRDQKVRVLVLIP